MGSLGAEEEPEILKPRTDSREYRKIVLPNGIKVLLISDADTDKVNCFLKLPLSSLM
jgi:insulysin